MPSFPTQILTHSPTQGTLVGPNLATGLAARYGSSLWVQGVGGPYTAGLAENFLPLGTSDSAIAEAKRLINLAASKCPNAAIALGGYSQGTAVVGNAVGQVSSSVQSKVKGVVLFGYTKNLQNGGKIVNFPSDKTKVYCALGDAVCTGTLTILPAHLSYGPDALTSAPAWLATKIGA